MRAVEFLIEAKGLFGRMPGDKFVNANGTEVLFADIVAYPQIEDDMPFSAYPDIPTRDQAIALIEQQINTKIEWVNQPATNMLAFAIATLNDQDGGQIFWGRYLKQVKQDMMGAWNNKDVPPGWKLATKSAKKLQAGYDPQSLIKTENKFVTASQVLQTVQANAPTEVAAVLVKNLTELASGTPITVFTGMGHQMEALRDYFGEIMQPMALIGGVIKGAAEEARQALAGGADWSQCKVMWPMSMNAALCDSFLIAPNGQEIGISSKGGKGAKASAKNLHDSYLKALKEGNKQLIDSAKYAITVVSIIAENSAKEGPYILGEYLNIPGIDSALYQEMNTYIANGKIDFNGLSPAAINIMAKFTVDPRAKGFNVGYALMAGVAKTVAATVNQNLEFSKGALLLLNQSSIIQVYTSMTKQGNDAVLSGFRAVYPPNFTGLLKMDGGKNYYSTRIAGKLAFGLD